MKSKQRAGVRFELFFVWSAIVICGCNDGGERGAMQEVESDSKRSSKPTGKFDLSFDSDTKMRSRLRSIAKESAQSNPYLGEEFLLNRFQRELESLPSYAVDFQRMILLNRIACGELMMGRDRAAIEHLENAIALSFDAETKLLANEVGPFRRLLIDLEKNLIRAWLRVAESENCVNCQNGEGCLFPIGNGGVHASKEGATATISLVKSRLAKDPNDLTMRWLLNLMVMSIGDFPDGLPREFRIPQDKLASHIDFRLSDNGDSDVAVDFPKFKNIGTELNVDSLDLSGGAIADDFDNDGWLDIVTSTSDTAGPMRFYKNNGDGTFADRSEESNLIHMLGGINIVQTDFDNDGNLDIYVMRGAWWGEKGEHPNSLLRNLGGGVFRDVTFEVGLGKPAIPSLSAAWADFDNDGDLDLFVGTDGSRGSQLFENVEGKFHDIASSAGVTNNQTVRGVTWGDFNNDDLPDLYVSNLSAANRLFRNNGDGTFTDVAEKVGVSKPVHSFPCWFWDANNDGNLDLYVCAYDGGINDFAREYFEGTTNRETQKLYLGRADGVFEDRTIEFGLDRMALAMGANFGDLDGDGYEDFCLGTGEPAFESLMPNLLFRNNAGARFEDVTIAAGMGHLQKGHGTAFADFDNDGDQDVYMQMGGAYKADVFGNALFQNPGFGTNWIKIKLIGETSNRAAIGARIKLEFIEDGKSRTVYRWINSGGSFGGNPLQREIGIGKATTIQTLEVYWPTSQTTQKFKDVKPNRLLKISESIRVLR